MSTIIYYISEDGNTYYEGPESEKPASGVVDVPQRPSQYHDWNFSKNQWELNAARKFLNFRRRRNKRLKNTFWLATDPDSPLTLLQKTALTTYRQNLRDYSLSDVSADNPEPVLGAAAEAWLDE